MKTKQISKITLAFLFFITSVCTIKAQERKETFEKTFKIQATGKFDFSCYDTDLKVNTWQKAEVKLVGEITIEGGDKNDQDELIEVFKNPEINQSANSLSIETNMANNTIIIGPFKKTTLVNGKVIRVEKYNAKYTLWIPESISFNLESKYNNIDITNLTGNVDFDLYDVDLTMLGFGKDSKFALKYSTASIGKGGDAIMDIYDCEIEAIEMNNVELTSKYSEIEISSINTLDFNSYDDDIKIEKINSLTSEAKYTEYTINSDMKNCLINFYDSDIKAQNINQLVFTGKYSSLVASDVKSAKINDLYDSKIELANVSEFNCNESKYDEIKFKSISKALVFTSAYELELTVSKTDPGFENFKGDFKYGFVKLPLDPAIEFNLKFNTTYGNVGFPKNRVRIKEMNFDDSKKSFEGSTTENPKCKIEFTAYETDFYLE